MTSDSNPIRMLGIYLHLARAAERRMRPLVRDRLLVLSAVAAARHCLPRIASLCRTCVLDNNPRHMVHRWERIEQAMNDEDFLHLLRQIERRYPTEKAERMLVELGIEMGNEREAYFTDEEYAASLLGATIEQLDERFGRDE